MTEARYRVLQDGEVIAGVSGPQPVAWEEIKRYAAEYVKDGPCVIERFMNGKWSGKWPEIAQE